MLYNIGFSNRHPSAGIPIREEPHDPVAASHVISSPSDASVTAADTPVEGVRLLST